MINDYKVLIKWDRKLLGGTLVSIKSSSEPRKKVISAIAARDAGVDFAYSLSLNLGMLHSEAEAYVQRAKVCHRSTEEISSANLALSVIFQQFYGRGKFFAFVPAGYR